MKTDTILPWRFDPARDAWAQADVPEAAAAAGRITLATLNVWFGEHAFDVRSEAVLDLLEASGADVVALQEVTGPFLERLLRREGIRRRFALSDASGITLGEYGMLILSRLPVRELRVHELPGGMGRTLLLARLAVGALDLFAGSVHLESYRESEPVRATQLAEIFRILEPAEDAAVMGDFNFCSTWEENRRLDPRYRDLWPALRPGEPGWTVDSGANTMRRALGKSDKKVRFDRILLHSERGRLRPEAIELLATRPLGTDLFPSDHFGLAATLSAGGP